MKQKSALSQQSEPTKNYSRDVKEEYPCSICCKRYKRIRSLKKHQAVNNNSSGITCTKCDKIVTSMRHWDGQKKTPVTHIKLILMTILFFSISCIIFFFFTTFNIIMINRCFDYIDYIISSLWYYLLFFFCIFYVEMRALEYKCITQMFYSTVYPTCFISIITQTKVLIYSYFCLSWSYS